MADSEHVDKIVFTIASDILLSKFMSRRQTPERANFEHGLGKFFCVTREGKDVYKGSMLRQKRTLEWPSLFVTFVKFRRA